MSAGVDARLSAFLRTDVRLREEADISHFDASPVHLLTTSALAWINGRGGLKPCADVRRFRPNVLLDVASTNSQREEDGWIGQRLEVEGSVNLIVTDTADRCVMTMMPQPGLLRAPNVLRAVAREANGRFGVYASVLRGGRLAVGDFVRITPDKP